MARHFKADDKPRAFGGQHAMKKSERKKERERERERGTRLCDLLSRPFHVTHTSTVDIEQADVHKRERETREGLGSLP